MLIKTISLITLISNTDKTLITSKVKLLQLNHLSQSFIIKTLSFAKFGVLKGVISQGYSIHRLVNPRGLIQTPPISWRSTSSCSDCQFQFLSFFLIFIISNGGLMKPPLYRWQGSLFWWVGAFCIREVDRCCHSS